MGQSNIDSYIENEDSFKTEEYGISVAARIIYQLGEQLISDEFVALAELIKNSYDADCTSVRINIDTKVNTNNGQGRIVIEDNGNGMTKSLLTNNFLRIATSFKTVHKYSPFFRRRTLGEKGLGRLSIQRLGNYLSLTTTPRIDRIGEIVDEGDEAFAKEYNEYHLSINWNDFKESDGDVENVKAKFSYVSNQEPRYGTRLVIEGIRNLDFWYLNRKLETRINSEIFGMVNPFEQKNKQKFQINLIIDDVAFTNKKINESLLDIMSEIRAEFSLNKWNLEIRVLFKKRYLDRLLNDLLNRMRGKGYKESEIIKPYEDFEQVININLMEEFAEDFPYLKDIKLQKKYHTNSNFEEFAHPGNLEGKLFVSDQTSEVYNASLLLLQENKSAFRTLKELKAIWQSAVGVYLFRNDFRIFPYGPKVDWLGVTSRSQRLKANALKEHTISGYVQLDSITSENLEEQTNRNGLIEDEYGKNFFIITSSVIAEIITRLDINLRATFNISDIENNEIIQSNDKNVIFKRVLSGAEQKQVLLNEVKQYTHELSSVASSIVPSDVTMKLKRIEEKITKIEEFESKDKDERKQEEFNFHKKIVDLKALVGLAGQGMIVEAMTHELHRIESNIRFYAKTSKELLKEGSFNSLKEAIEYQDNIIQEVVFLQQQLEHLEPTYKKNSILLQEINITQFIRDLYTGNAPMAQKAKKINAKVYVSGESMLLTANKGLLITIFDNLFINSLFWVELNSEAREIYFSINNTEKRITIYDSGPGIHPTIINTLFQPYESMKQDGRGLGLYIVKELLNSINGSIQLNKEDKNKKGNFFKFIINFNS
ncbi:ATP-binding protein [Paenibacillus silvae]|uniref:histidine kinase n=1 Tax=Paenibacillus silvae TaxID=1325358 RepID=A0A2W6NI54_9BACL|nr:ATP-binding protein [Paenibacillus silvae]PZT55627.1 hypothetical protein DN757_11120 [Paenibacillus silvae]